MENNNKDIENKIFVSIKDKAKTLSSAELKKSIKDELTANSYEDWQIEYAVDRIEKMIKKENLQGENKAVEQKPNKIYNTIAYIFGVILVFSLVKLLVPVVVSLINGNNQNNTYSNTEIINNAVKQIKDSKPLPYKIDAVTTAVDITAEQNAVRYHYLISDFDTSNLTDDFLKKDLLSSVCNNEGGKVVLNKGINIEFSYTVKNSPETFFISITREDCLNYQIPQLNFPNLQPVKVESK